MSTSPLDLTKISAYYGGSPEVLLNVFRKLLLVLPDEWALLETQLGNNEVASASVVAHRLSGSVAMVGADALAEDLRQLSHILHASEISPPTKIAAIKSDFDQVLLEIETFVRQNDSPQA